MSVMTGNNATVYLGGVGLNASRWTVVATDDGWCEPKAYARLDPVPQASDTDFRHLSLRRENMGTRYLFLGTSGVLNSMSGQGFMMSPDRYDSSNLLQLNSVLDAVPGLRVVLSGAWHEYRKLPAWREHLLAAGVSPKMNLVGVAPSTGRTRGADVAAAMLSLGDVWAEDVVVLDDRPLKHPPLEHRLVMTDPKHGLTLRETLAVICMLRGYDQ